MEPTFWGKLKDDFATVTIGVLVGLPAIGVVIPKIFSVLGDQHGIELPGLFKIFSMLYFTMPLILLFALSFFQFTNDILIKLQKMVWGIIILIVVVFIFLLLPVWGTESSTGTLLKLIAILILLLWGYYWWFFQNTIQILLSDIGSLNVEKARKLKEEIIKTDSTDKNESTIIKKTYDLNYIDEKLAENIASIKLGVFYFFIASQLVIVILLTLFNKLYDSYWCIAAMLLLYAVVFLYYKFNYGLRELRASKEISNSFIPVILIIAIISIALVFYICKNKGEAINFSGGSNEYFNNFSGVDTVKKIQDSIARLDTIYKKIELQKADEKTKVLPLSFLNLLLSGSNINRDSVDVFNTRIANYFTIVNPKPKGNIGKSIGTFFKLYTHGTIDTSEIIKKISDLDTLAQSVPLSTDGKNVEKIKTYQQKVVIQKNRIKTDKLYKLVTDSNSKHYYTWQIQQNINRLYRNVLSIHETVRNDKVKLGEINMIKDTQHAGMIIFITTLIVILSFLLILNYKDDQYHLETLPEVQPIRKILQIVCLIIIILLIPLIKVVPEEQINPEKPSSLFLVSNWNLSKSIAGEEDEDRKSAISKSKTLPSHVILSGEPIDTESIDGGRLKGRNDTLIIKFSDGTIATIKEPLNNLTQAQDTNSILISKYFSEINQLLIKMNKNPNNKPDDNYKKLLVAMDTLNSIMKRVNGAQNNSNVNLQKIDSAITKLYGIQTAIENSQVKSLTKP